MSELLKALIVSGSLGALVGLERQWDERARDPNAVVPAGLRTFGLWGMLGALCAHFAGVWHPLIFAAGLLALALWMTAHITASKSAGPGSGLTTAAASAVIYLVGGLVYLKDYRTSVVLTVVLLFLLVGKSRIHHFTGHLREEDVRLALQFLAVSGVVLPLVPDMALGPYGAINPRSVWLMVVIVSGLGFAGYVAIRLLGPSLGIALTGLAGGLASSTATTLSMSRLSRERPELEGDCAMAIVLACTVMLWRVNFLVFAISPPLASALVGDFLIMSLPGIAFSIWQFIRRRGVTVDNATLRNPLSLKVAMQFAAIYAVVVVLAKSANARFGEAGLMVASFLSGLTDLDAIALSVSGIFSAGGTDLNFAAAAIVLAAVANSLLKLGLAVGMGCCGLRVRVAALLGVTSLVGSGIILARLFA